MIETHIKTNINLSQIFISIFLLYNIWINEASKSIGRPCQPAE